MTQMVASICNAMGVEPPKQADKSIPLVDEFVKSRMGEEKVDRVLIYNPDCIGHWHLQKYTDLFIPVLVNTELTVPLSTVSPAWTPICFGSMYTGVPPLVHGILKYEKPIIKVDSFFDALPRSGKKVANVAVDHSSMAMIFLGRPVDYYIMPYDNDVVEIHRTTPESEQSLDAIRHHVSAFVRLVEAVRENWKDHNTLVVFAPDHGNHYDCFGHGNHGEYRDEDVNINHFYTIIKKQK